MTDEENIVTSQAIYRTSTLERRLERMLRWFARKRKKGGGSKKVYLKPGQRAPKK